MFTDCWVGGDQTFYTCRMKCLNNSLKTLHADYHDAFDRVHYYEYQSTCAVISKRLCEGVVILLWKGSESPYINTWSLIQCPFKQSSGYPEDAHGDRLSETQCRLTTLHFMMDHLQRVLQAQKTRIMTYESFAICLTPCLFGIEAHCSKVAHIWPSWVKILLSTIQLIVLIKDIHLFVL